MPQLEYRAKAYTRGTPETPRGAETLLVSGFTTEAEAERILSALLASGLASGGHTEQHLQGIGWILREETEDPEAEPRHPHDMPCDLCEP